MGNSKADNNDISSEIIGARAAVFDALVRVSQLEVAGAVGSVVATAINSLGSMSGGDPVDEQVRRVDAWR